MIISQEEYLTELMNRAIYPLPCCPLLKIESSEIPYWFRALGIAQRLVPALEELKKQPNRVILFDGSWNESPRIFYNFMVCGTPERKLTGKGFVVIPDEGHEGCGCGIINRFMYPAIEAAKADGGQQTEIIL